MSLDEFSLICRALFRNDKGKIYDIPKDRLHFMFEVFDDNKDGYIDRDEFKFCWNNWIKSVSKTSFNVNFIFHFDYMISTPFVFLNC